MITKYTNLDEEKANQAIQVYQKYGNYNHAAAGVATASEAPG